MKQIFVVQMTAVLTIAMVVSSACKSAPALSRHVTESKPRHGDDRQSRDQTAHERPAEVWLQRLRETRFLRIEAKCTRETIHRRIDGNVLGSSETLALVTVRAEAVMKPNALWLVAWDDVKAKGPPEDQPSLKLELTDGQIRETLWYPAFSQFRTQQYPAPSKFGANDTKYEQGCQIGTLLRTWLGDSQQRDVFRNYLDQAELAPQRESVAGHPCHVYSFKHETREASDEQRVDTFFLDDTGMLRRWQTVATAMQQDKQSQVVQTRDYEFDFTEPDVELVPDAAATMPAPR